MATSLLLETTNTQATTKWKYDKRLYEYNWETRKLTRWAGVFAEV